jgi:serine/threonine-protein kinase
MPLVDGEVIAGYTILRSLGAGGMGEVYPSETESPFLVCMEQTGPSHVDCHNDILQGNPTATQTPSP